MRLKVPHFTQLFPHTCIPACVRMVLAYYGKEHSEQDLTSAFNTIPYLGTSPETAVAGLEKLNYHALWFEDATVERLYDFLDTGWPIIVFLRASDLPHGRSGIHAVVIIGLENDRFICHDPTLEEPALIPLSIFQEMWAKLENQGLAIWL